MTEQPDKFIQGNSELLAAAQAYHEQGIAIIPFIIGDDGKKKPKISEWEMWKERPQTKEEFEDLHIENYRMFGVVCGTKTTDGYYFTVIDRDVKGSISPEILTKSLAALNKMPPTQREKSMSGGQHALYYSKTQFKGKKLNDIGMELLALGQLCVMSPSEGYSKELSSDVIATVENTEDIFYNAIEAAGINKHKKPTVATVKPVTYRKKNLRPCFEDLVRTDHLEHQQKVALIYEMFYCGRSEQDIFEIFKENESWEHPPEHVYNAVQTQDQVTYTVGKAKSGSYRYLKTTLEEIGICHSQCPLYSLPDCRKKPTQRESVEPIAELAKPIQEKHIFVVDENTRGLYIYQPKEGTYTNDTEYLINQEICVMLDDDTRVKYYKEVDNWIRNNPKTPHVTMDPDNGLIAFNNGVYNIETKELVKPSPDFYLTNKIPHDFIVGADNPPFKKFLKEVYNNNESKIKQLQEILGKTIARKNRIYHIILILCGEGNNGKSVLLDVIGYCLGKRKNISTVTLQALSNDKFERAKIKNKMANICADLPSELMKHIGVILMISAGDPITIQDKYDDPIPNYEPNISLLFSCNEAPAIDSSQDHYGTYRRIVMHDFEIIFEPQTKENPNPAHPEDKDLRNKLMVEAGMPGVINWILEGYYRLRSQNEITDRPSVKDTRIAYIRRSDSPHAFIIDKLMDTNDDKDIIFDEQLYREFITYCVEKNLTRRSKGELTKALNKFLPGAEHTKYSPSKESERKPCWRYLRRKADKDETAAKDHVEKVYDYIKTNERKDGLVLKAAIMDTVALNQLLKAGKVFEPKEGYVKTT